MTTQKISNSYLQGYSTLVLKYFKIVFKRNLSKNCYAEERALEKMYNTKLEMQSLNLV